MSKLRSPDIDVQGMHERMDAIRRKAMLHPEELTEREHLCLAMEFPVCPSCGGSSRKRVVNE
jgi:hypothetical protein